MGSPPGVRPDRRLLSLTAALFPMQAFALKFNKPLSVRRLFLPPYLHKDSRRQVRVHGGMHATSPVLFTCNHTSYSDIAILVPVAGLFVATEVAGWPLFGV